MKSSTKLYIVATPIGNLKDITLRAIEVLKEVDVIAAEDTRTSKKLLQHYGIQKPMMALHEHNERSQVENILAKLGQGKNIALISDAGTPLISDPGAKMVASVRAEGYEVSPIPGPCAAVSALSVSGIENTRFCFEGFLPAKAQARIKALEVLKHESRTIIFYESPHRILETLNAISEVFSDRKIMLIKEITKIHESIVEGSAQEVVNWIQAEPGREKGEFVLLIESVADAAESVESDLHLRKCLHSLLPLLPTKQVVDLLSDIFSKKRNLIYKMALEYKDSM
ncbi:MAG: 16S rRNA (cytidine(1402)-2'-O)-methyltransferase [Gammaproteobacteria bacterium]